MHAAQKLEPLLRAKGPKASPKSLAQKSIGPLVRANWRSSIRCFYVSRVPSRYICT